MLFSLTEPDVEQVLALNDRFVHFTAPMDAVRLARSAEIGRVEVVRVDGRFAGFVITFRAGSDYDSSNFAWFSERYDDFTYLDRIVLHEDFQRRGLGTLVYDAVERRAAPGLLALEVNVDPPNEPSLSFHRARDFEVVGERDFAGHTVAMMVKKLA